MILRVQTAFAFKPSVPNQVTYDIDVIYDEEGWVAVGRGTYTETEVGSGEWRAEGSELVVFTENELDTDKLEADGFVEKDIF